MNRLYLWLALVMLSPSFGVCSQDDAVIFTATPERCIALHKGQTCYQDVLFRWQTPASGEYCLILSDHGHQLTCWTGKALQEYQYSFEGDKTATFSLIRNDDVQPLAQVKVVMTWVYKAPKQSQSGWRVSCKAHLSRRGRYLSGRMDQ